MANKDLKGFRLTVYSRYFEGYEWEIDHSIVDEEILFFAADTSWKTILPQEVQKMGSGILKVTFPISVSGYGSVFRFTPILNGKTQTISTPTDSVSFIHGFGNQQFILQAWDADGKLVIPKEIKKFERTCTVEFHEDFTGTLNLVRTIGETEEFESTVEWIYTVGKKEVQGHMFVQINDDTDQVVLPGEEQRVDTNPAYTIDNKITLSWAGQEVAGTILPIIHGYRI